MKQKPENTAPLPKLRLERDRLSQLSQSELKIVVGAGPNHSSRCTSRTGCTQDIGCILSIGACITDK